jgi:hypothetical protein
MQMSESLAFLSGSSLASNVEKMTGCRYLTSNAGTTTLVTVPAIFTSWVRLLIFSRRKVPSYFGPITALAIVFMNLLVPLQQQQHQNAATSSFKKKNQKKAYVLSLGKDLAAQTMGFS